MSLDNQIANSPLDLTALLSSLLPRLLSILDEPKDRAEDLRAKVQHALRTRLAALAAPDNLNISFDDASAEERRLQTLFHIVPGMGEDALRQVLGLVQLDGRPGDYVPASRLDASADLWRVGPFTDAERLEGAVRRAVHDVDLDPPNQIATVLVKRGAAASASAAIERELERRVTIIASTSLTADDWTVDDLLVVQPKAE